MTEDGIASQLNSELSQAQLDTQRLGQQFSLYRLQASTLRNLLLVSSTTIDELNQGITRQQQALQELGTAATQGAKSIQPLEERKLRAKVRQEVYQQQVNELKNLPQASIPKSLLTLVDQISLPNKTTEKISINYLRLKKRSLLVYKPIGMKTKNYWNNFRGAWRNATKKCSLKSRRSHWPNLGRLRSLLS